MLIKDIKDAERYLENDCYCKYEVYDLTGFFYNLIKPEYECMLIGESEEQGITVVAIENVEKYHALDENPQLLIFLYDGDKIAHCNRVDATENNVKLVKIMLEYGVQDALNHTDLRFNEFKPGHMAESVREILSVSDAVMVD